MPMVMSHLKHSRPNWHEASGARTTKKELIILPDRFGDDKDVNKCLFKRPWADEMAIIVQSLTTTTII